MSLEVWDTKIKHSSQLTVAELFNAGKMGASGPWGLLDGGYRETRDKRKQWQVAVCVSYYWLNQN